MGVDLVRTRVSSLAWLGGRIWLWFFYGFDDQSLSWAKGSSASRDHGESHVSPRSSTNSIGSSVYNSFLMRLSCVPLHILKAILKIHRHPGYSTIWPAAASPNSGICIAAMPLIIHLAHFTSPLRPLGFLCTHCLGSGITVRGHITSNCWRTSLHRRQTFHVECYHLACEEPGFCFCTPFGPPQPCFSNLQNVGGLGDEALVRGSRPLALQPPTIPRRAPRQKECMSGS